MLAMLSPSKPNTHTPSRTHSFLFYSPMAASSTTDLKQRIITPEGQTTTTTTTNDKNGSTINHKRDKRTAMAKRGLRSLIIAVSFPLSITLLSI
jgi:hypothetical protein